MYSVPLRLKLLGGGPTNRSAARDEEAQRAIWAEGCGVKGLVGFRV